MNLKEFKEKYPDIYKAVFDEGSKAGKAEGLAEGKTAGIEEGKTANQETVTKAAALAERERIKGIEDLAMPGHDALIQEMKFDGETTEAAAAIKLIQAENEVRKVAGKALEADGITPVKHVATDGAGTDTGTPELPEGPEKWKAEFQASADLQKITVLLKSMWLIKMPLQRAGSGN